MPLRRLLFAGTFAVIAAVPGAASADGGPDLSKTDVLFLPIGLNLGGAVNQGAPNGFVLGGEVSAVYLYRTWAWTGAYVDVLRDFGAGATRFSIGPEGGWGPFGLDGGFLIEERGGQAHPGTALRLVLSASVLTLYGRWGHVFGDDERNFAEIGVLIKFPIAIWEKKSQPEVPWQGPPPPPLVPPEQPARPVPRDQPVQMVPRDQPVQPLP
jgi:hypothetical protein